MAYQMTVAQPMRGRSGAPSPCVMGKAERLFRGFHCFPAGGIVRQRCRRMIPGVLVHLGRLKGLIYSSDRGTPGRSTTYIHFMKRPPRLACDPGGTQLYIIGGRYRVTRRGIEG